MDAALLATYTTADLQRMRREALDALHQLRIGKRVQTLTHAGQARTFYDVGELEAYIAAIQTALDGAERRAPRRAIMPRWAG
jgi:hypothetical protein